jgi:hypothetical protein
MQRSDQYWWYSVKSIPIAFVCFKNALQYSRQRLTWAFTPVEVVDTTCWFSLQEDPDSDSFWMKLGGLVSQFRCNYCATIRCHPVYSHLLTLSSEVAHTPQANCQSIDVFAGDASGKGLKVFSCFSDSAIAAHWSDPGPSIGHRRPIKSNNNQIK